MDILFHTLLKVNNAEDSVSIENFANDENIKKYIFDLITNCANSDGDREYIFDSTLETTKNNIYNIINNRNREGACKLLAEKLLLVEKETMTKIAHLGKEIPKGMLMISFAKMTNTEYKFVITKADYSDFLEESSGEEKSGLPTKKKIFKSFIMNVTRNNDDYTEGKILTYDSNTSTKAAYWWKTFLELNEIRDNDQNTKTAYNAIKRVVLEPIRKNHKEDYFYLRNATIAYFRTEGEFNFNHYKDDILGGYKPVDANLNIENFKKSIEKLPIKYSFDPVFEKNPSVVKEKFKDVINLTSDIELKLKQDILNINRVIKAKDDGEGNKYIMILSPEGYQYALGLGKQQNE